MWTVTGTGNHCKQVPLRNHIKRDVLLTPCSPASPQSLVSRPTCAWCVPTQSYRRSCPPLSWLPPAPRESGGERVTGQGGIRDRRVCRRETLILRSTLVRFYRMNANTFRSIHLEERARSSQGEVQSDVPENELHPAGLSHQQPTHQTLVQIPQTAAVVFLLLLLATMRWNSHTNS